MKRTSALLLATAAFAFMIPAVGCDLGTYQDRASSPIPENTMRAGEVGSAAAAVTEDDEGEVSE